MIRLPAGVPLEATAGLLQQVGRHGEVDLRMPDVDVPQVDREVVKKPLHIRPLLIPLDQAMNGEAMTHVVQPRLVSSTVRPAYPRTIPEPFERVIHRLHLNRGPTLAEEESTLRVIPWVRCRSPTGVCSQHACQLWSDRDQAGLEELGVPDGDQGV